MNRFHHVHLAPRSGKVKHHLIWKGKTLSQPAIRLSLVVFASCALVATNSNAGGLAPVTKDLIQPGVQVWLTKGQHKLNLDSKGVILKGVRSSGLFHSEKGREG
jgi:hypothetical protein